LYAQLQASKCILKLLGDIIRRHHFFAEEAPLHIYCL